MPDTTEETGVAERRSGSTISTLGVVVVEEPAKRALDDFNPAAHIASTHGSQDDVVDEVLEEL